MALRMIATYRYLPLLGILMGCLQCSTANAEDAPAPSSGEEVAATPDEASTLTATAGAPAPLAGITAPSAAATQPPTAHEEPSHAPTLPAASDTPSIQVQRKALLQAVQRGDADAVSALLDGTPVSNEHIVLHARGDHDNTPLHEAAKSGHTHLMDPLVQAVNATQRSQWINRKNTQQATALDMAVEHCRTEAVAKLLALGANKRNTSPGALPHTPATRVERRIGELQRRPGDHAAQIQQLAEMLQLLGSGDHMPP